MTEPTQGPPVPPSPGAGTPFPPTGSTPGAPGSRAWVEQHYGRTAAFADRIVPGIIDGLISAAAALIPCILGIICLVAGMPDTYDCGGYYYSDSCEVPGSGSGILIFIGVLLFLLTFLTSLAVVAWNRVWRVTKTGQSIGKKIMGLRIVDAHTGEHPQLGAAALRELVHQFAGIISWIWMLVDDDDRTLADIVGKTHVIHADT